MQANFPDYLLAKTLIEKSNGLIQAGLLHMTRDGVDVESKRYFSYEASPPQNQPAPTPLPRLFSLDPDSASMLP
jgi:hypothetical protein